MVKFRPLISPLFVPANRPERFAKAASSGADAIIVDLEDAVPPQEKDVARDGLSDALGDLTTSAFLRINARGTEWFEADLRCASSLSIAGIMLPKSEYPDDVAAVSEYVGEDTPVVVLVETALGLANLSDLAAVQGVAQLAFGSIDYALDLNCGETREALSHARSEIVFRSRVAELPAPVDGVTANVSDLSVLSGDCDHAVALGFGGKLAVHPKQVPVIRSGFSPSQETLNWARRVLQAETEANGAAIQVDGRMVDRPVAEKARRILALHG